MGLPSCGIAFVKVLMFIINFFVFALGGTCLGIGIWLAVGQSSLFNFVKQVNYSVGSDLSASPNSYLQMGSYVLIACGAFAIVVGFCGCWGTITDSKLFIILYMVFCSVVLILLIAAGVLAAVFQGTILTAVQTAATSALNTSFDGQTNSSNLLSITWNYAMQTYQCCGMNGVGDFTITANQTANFWLNNHWYCLTNGTCYYGSRVQVPPVCCKFINNNYQVQTQMTDQLCPINLTPGTFNPQGCAVSITAWASTAAAVLIGVSFGLPNVILLAIFGAEAVRRHINRNI